MRFRSGSAMSAVVIAGALISVAAGQAFAAEGGTARPLQGVGEVTTALDLCTAPLSGTIEGPLNTAHLGLTTVSLAFTITPGTPLQTGSGTLTAANGDKLFVDFTGIITSTDPLDNRSTSDFTITGGTGRFENASGSFTAVAVGSVVSSMGCTQTLRHSTTSDGTISY